MRHRSVRTLLPILALALAFALGSIGTASASGLTKGAVKRIAAKVVKKAAPALSVAHASAADNATNATNATNLGGLPANTYLNRVAFTSATTGTIPAGNTNSLLGPLPLVVPAGVNFVTIQGSASFDTAAMGFGVYYAVDSVCSTTGTPFSLGQYEDTNPTGSFTQASATIDVAVPVTAGLHTFRLCSNNSAGTVIARTLLVTTVANGSSGTSAPKGAQKAAGAPGVAP